MNEDSSKCSKIVKEDRKVSSKHSRIPYYPLVIKQGRGSIVEDVDGNKYIDLLSSASALNTGHAHPKVVNSIIEQTKRFIHYTPAYTYHEPFVELSNELISITPGNFKKRVSYGLSGSDANDGMIKLARAYTGRSKIISFTNAYHGSTYGSISLSALSLNMRRKIGPLLPDIHHIPYPDCYRCMFNSDENNCKLQCIKQLEEALAHFIPPEEVAAIVMEPIAGDAGLIVPPKKYVRRLHEICQQYGILFVSEEVQQGFGRTGKWFAIEHFDIVPDIIVMAKAIASGMPLSAIVAREEIMQSLEAPAHLFTTSGNPVACQAALATIEVIKEEKLIENSKILGKYVKNRLLDLKEKYEIIGDVRGLGLSIGVDLVTDRITKEKAKDAAAKICYRCCEKGLILIFISGSVIRIQPPLIITKEEMDYAIDVIEESIQEYLDGDISDSVLSVSQGW